MIQGLSVFWGDKHLELWRRGLLKSLGLPENQRALKEHGCTWNIFCEPKNFDYVKRNVFETVPDLPQLNLVPFEKLRDRTDYLLSGTIWQIEKCVELNEPMLLLPSDTLFGDGSIRSMLTVGVEKGSVVFVPHPRVLPAILEENYTTNAELVSMSWKHLHRSWSEAKRGHPRQNSFVGGTAWDELAPNLMSITHRLPTPYVCNFIPSDLDYFKLQTGYGVYDHSWPGESLLRQGRMRFIGSSDAAFMCEVTEKDKNVPPIFRGGDPEKFWKTNFHNEINRQFTGIWRKAEASQNRFG